LHLKDISIEMEEVGVVVGEADFVVVAEVEVVVSVVARLEGVGLVEVGN
jgi:uncharacterized protein with GYD domain